MKGKGKRSRKERRKNEHNNDIYIVAVVDILLEVSQ